MIFLPDAHRSTTESHGVPAAGLLWGALLPLARRRRGGVVQDVVKGIEQLQYQEKG